MASSELLRFFMHYPHGSRLYVCIVDQKRRAFDFTDNTFKAGNQLVRMTDASLHAESRHDERADHHCSYSVEFDLTRLSEGRDPATIPGDAAIVSVHWLEQMGDEPDVSVDRRLTNTCSLRKVNGKFVPANKWDADHLDEKRAFEQRERFGKEYREFVLREIDQTDLLHDKLARCVREGDVAGVLRVLASDICLWAGNLKTHCLHEITHSAKDPSFVGFLIPRPNSPFEVMEGWVVRDWIGTHVAYDLLEFHKGKECAQALLERLESLHQERAGFSRHVTEYVVKYRGEDSEGIFAVDEARKELKHRALFVAEYIDIIAQQLEATKPKEGSQRKDAVDAPKSAASEESSVASGLREQNFSGGTVVYFPDRVELCGVDICSGKRSKSRRIVLDLLGAKKADGSFEFYSGEELEREAIKRGAKGSASRWISDLRDDIMEKLRNHAGIICDHKNIILSGDSGYRFAECLSVQHLPSDTTTDIGDIKDTDDSDNVPNQDVRDVFNVRNDTADARRTWIMERLSSGARLKVAEIAEQFGCTPKTAQRDIALLRKEGIIEPVGPTRNRYYVLVKVDHRQS